MGRSKKCRPDASSCLCRNCPGDYDQYQSDSNDALEPSAWKRKEKIIVIHICSSSLLPNDIGQGYYGYFSLNGRATLVSTTSNGHIGRIYKSDENTTISDSERTFPGLLSTVIDCGGEAEQESFDPDILLPNPPPLPWPDPNKKTKNVISFGFSGGITPLLSDGVNCEVIVASYPYPYHPRYDEDSFTFSWPVSGATITSQVSFKHRMGHSTAYFGPHGVVTFLRTVGSLHYYTYTLPYNASERLGRWGETYKFTDGTFTQYFNTECTYYDRRWRRGGNWNSAWGYGTYECRIARYRGFVPFYSTQYLEFELCPTG
jgi:hypothetical protein